MAKVHALVIAIGAPVFRVVLVYEEEKRLSSKAVAGGLQKCAEEPKSGSCIEFVSNLDPPIKVTCPQCCPQRNIS
jgi:hypothetical protein